MRGDEARVIEAFCAYLTSNGWNLSREVEFCDVFAQRGDERMYAEAKGRTAAIGLDVDTLYGQLLRRMPPEEVLVARFGVVVPTEARTAALRVPKRVRDVLRIDVFVVGLDGTVEMATV